MDQSSPSPSTDAQMLISQLERLTRDGGNNNNNNNNKHGTTQSLLPTPRQMFVIGGILFRTTTSQQQQSAGNDLLFAYQHLVDSLPDFHWKYILTAHQKAIHRLAHDNDEIEDLETASRALNGLFTNAPRLCQLAYSTAWVSTLSIIYDKMMRIRNSDATTNTSQKHVVLSTLSSLLLDGLLLPLASAMKRGERRCTSSSPEEELLEAIQAMEEHSMDCLGDLQGWQSDKDPFRRTLESEIQKLPRGGDTRDDDDGGESQQQREYILNMLESARQKESSSLSTSSTPTTAAVANSHGKKKPAANNSIASKPVAAADELERRIHQVKQILPDFGEGFIETALSLNQGDVETTVSILLGDPSTYPSALRFLDRSLPRRRKERAQEEAEHAAEARQLVKERVAMEAKQEEARYKALLYMQKQEEKAAQQQQPTAVVQDEYDDDYDDQYDEIDVKLGGADDGMYDFEQVKLYNQLVRTEEADDSFWQENRNTNRMPAKNSKNKQSNKGGGGEDSETNDNGKEEEEVSGGKQYRGPDKIKGGRVIGPDGKVVRKPGGARGKNNKGNNPGAGQGGAQPPNHANNSSNGTSSGSQTNSTSQQQPTTKGKPRTKPKAQNRVNRQRDKKQKAQGTFGAEK